MLLNFFNLKNYIIILVIGLVLILPLVANVNVVTGAGEEEGDNKPTCVAEGNGVGIWQNVPNNCQTCGYCSLCDLVQIGVNIGMIIMGVVGGLALMFFMYGGFILLVSGGRTGEIQKGQTILINTAIGFIIVISAYLIITLLVAVVTGGWSWQANLAC